MNKRKSYRSAHTHKQVRTYTRNRVKGQIAMAQACLSSCLRASVLSVEDVSVLNSCNVSLIGVLQRWNPHYIAEENAKATSKDEVNP